VRLAWNTWKCSSGELELGVDPPHSASTAGSRLLLVPTCRIFGACEPVAERFACSAEFDAGAHAARRLGTPRRRQNALVGRGRIKSLSIDRN